MIPYANRSGKSGVAEYEIGDNFIRVRFVDSSVLYTYNHTKPGAVHVGRMKQLADDGEGLSTYISQQVKKNYYRKD